jgi:hypothetical protein
VIKGIRQCCAIDLTAIVNSKRSQMENFLCGGKSNHIEKLSSDHPLMDLRHNSRSSSLSAMVFPANSDRFHLQSDIVLHPECPDARSSPQDRLLAQPTFFPFPLRKTGKFTAPHSQSRTVSLVLGLSPSFSRPGNCTDSSENVPHCVAMIVSSIRAVRFPD